jgi:3-oxoacyl-[acyl-carrier protein] reductase
MGGNVMDLGLNGKIALVTGAASPRGNGRRIAVTLAEEGADVVCADINIEGAEAVANEIRKMGRRSMAVNVDQGKYEQVRDGVKEIKEELGPIDILVNNAAFVGVHATISKLEVPIWDKQVSVNLYGPWYWIKETFDSMAEKKWGRIINISSVAGILGGFGQCSYSSSKGGLISLTKTAALEGARFGITANAVTPGTIATDAIGTVRSDLYERIKKRVPMRRAGEPSDIASSVAFLASERAGYITGANLVVDGGLQLFVF